jgi:hypothetical protein
MYFTILTLVVAFLFGSSRAVIIACSDEISFAGPYGIPSHYFTYIPDGTDLGCVSEDIAAPCEATVGDPNTGVKFSSPFGTNCDIIQSSTWYKDGKGLLTYKRSDGYSAGCVQNPGHPDSTHSPGYDATGCEAQPQPNTSPGK